MKGCDITTTSTRGTFLSVNHWQLTSSRHLRCAVRSSCIVLVSRETLLYERVNIDAKIGPAFSCNHSVWNSWACLIGCDSLDTIAESESSLDLCLETNLVTVGLSTEITLKNLSSINDNQIKVDHLIRVRGQIRYLRCVCLSLGALWKMARSRVQRFGRRGTGVQYSGLMWHQLSWYLPLLYYESRSPIERDLVVVGFADHSNWICFLSAPGPIPWQPRQSPEQLRKTCGASGLRLIEKQMLESLAIYRNLELNQ